MDNVIKLRPNTELTKEDFAFIDSIYTSMQSKELIGFGEYCIKFAELAKDQADNYIIEYRDSYIEIWLKDDYELKRQGEPGVITIS